MGLKTFYQTLYQSEHLFRMPAETLTDWGVVLAEPAPPVPAPVVPPVRLPNEPVAIVIESPTELLQEEEAEQAVEELISETLLIPETLAVPTEVAQLVEPVLQDTKPPLRTPERPALIKHKVLLLADEDLTPSDLLFLEKILKAVNLDINGVDLLNLYGVAEVDFAAVLRHKYINHFITFGVPFSRINLDIMMDRYHPIRFDGITFLMADSLPVIEASQPLKKQLWNSLKRIFELG